MNFRFWDEDGLSRYNQSAKHHEIYQAVYKKRKEILEGPMVEVFEHRAELRGDTAA